MAHIALIRSLFDLGNSFLLSSITLLMVTFLEENHEKRYAIGRPIKSDFGDLKIPPTFDDKAFLRAYKFIEEAHGLLTTCTKDPSKLNNPQSRAHLANVLSRISPYITGETGKSISQLKVSLRGMKGSQFCDVNKNSDNPTIANNFDLVGKVYGGINEILENTNKPKSSQ